MDCKQTVIQKKKLPVTNWSGLQLLLLRVEIYKSVLSRSFIFQDSWWRKYNVEHSNVPLEISGETCPTKNVLSFLNGQRCNKESIICVYKKEFLKLFGVADALKGRKSCAKIKKILRDLVH